MRPMERQRREEINWQENGFNLNKTLCSVEVLVYTTTTCGRSGDRHRGGRRNDDDGIPVIGPFWFANDFLRHFLEAFVFVKC